MADAPRIERECPWCAETILAKAVICKHCGRDVEPATAVPQPPVMPAPADNLTSAEMRGPIDSVDSTMPADAIDTTAAAVSDMRSPPARTLELPNGGGSPTGSSGEHDAPPAPAHATRRPAPQLGALEQDGLRGVGGWLAWFVLGQVITVLWYTYLVYDTTRSAVSLRPIFALVDPAVVSDLYAATAFYALCTVGAVVGLFLMWGDNPRTPTYWCAFLCVLLVLLVVHAGIIADLTERLTSVAGGPQNTGSEGTQARAFVVTLAWLLYWIRSKRVRATYGYSGFRRGTGSSGLPHGPGGHGARSAASGFRLSPTEVGVLTAVVLGALIWIATLSGGTSRSATTHATKPDDAPNGGTSGLVRAYSRYLPMLDSVLPPQPGVASLARLDTHHAEMQRGWHEIRDSELVHYATALGHLYAALPDSLCAQFAGTSASQAAIDAFGDVLLQSDPSTQDALVQGQILSLVADLRHTPGRDPSDAASRAAFRLLGTHLGARDAERLSPLLVDGLGSASAADACWALGILYNRVPAELPTAQAAAILRVIR